MLNPDPVPSFENLARARVIMIADPLQVATGKAKIEKFVSDAAASLALTEIALGSLVHGLKIPLGGHLLSLNQAAFLSHVTKCLKAESSPFRFSIYVSSISAVLKSLSPAGNKLGPMLSISTQGFLFAGPVAAFGPSLFAVITGSILLSFWAFIQPFATLYLFYGNDLNHAIHFYLEKTRSSLGVEVSWLEAALIGLIALKALAAGVIGTLSYRASEKKFSAFHNRYLGKWLQSTGRTDSLDPSRGAPSDENHKGNQIDLIKLTLRDLTRPLFLASILFMGVFFFFLEHSWSKTIWLLLRPLAVAFIFFYLSRSPLASVVARRLTNRLRRSRRLGLFMVLYDQTLAKISELRKST